MEFKTHLVQARKAHGLSQEQLAAQVGVSRQAVSKWETGDTLPDLPKLLILAEVLNISIDALCGREIPTDLPTSEKNKAPKKPRLRKPLAVLLCILLMLSGSFFAGMQFGGASKPTEFPVPPLPETVSFTGVFFSVGEGGLLYQFVPSIAGEAYSYQITFNGYDSASHTFDAPYRGGICTDTIALSESDSYSVTLVVSNGQDSRAALVASNLNFSSGSHSASWTPSD
jgi:transcriptional regulator with XRE-family HTH domain